jgi:choline/glycine/proline betaine transport protein
MNSIASGDKPGSPKWQKIFWGAMLCIISLSLLRIGGLKALQTMTLVFALPFAITMLVLCYCLMKALRLDIKYHNTKLPYGSASWNARGWKELLNKITSFSGKKDIIYYMNNIVTPAFNELSSAFEEKGIQSRIENGKKDKIPYMELIIPHNKIRNFKYGVTSLSQDISEYIQSEKNTPDTEQEKSYIPVSYFNDGRRGNDLEYLDKDELIADILKEYERFINIVADESSRLLVLDKKTLF